ncbi:DUF4250 domain-containing protein [Clostridium sp. OS1-26]|uniref:DUF4250 domain-containing protein n=1 Tax=Clostridium sp. OS1-26 TaxID=3070681 RepID=UPI0027E15FAD|nr:DUF4250 domain-containing protein [Clostridium sp. OS1-26]WML33622.1 DUF4250 domain-containing protein [Clostridium sp. OS1-26]
MNKDQMLSMDPYMLLSFINTKLRDEFESIESLAIYYDLKERDIIDKLSAVGYEYDRITNQFK